MVDEPQHIIIPLIRGSDHYEPGIDGDGYYYIHIPPRGIESLMRENFYEQEVLPLSAIAKQQYILSIRMFDAVARIVMMDCVAWDDASDGDHLGYYRGTADVSVIPHSLWKKLDDGEPPRDYTEFHGGGPPLITTGKYVRWEAPVEGDRNVTTEEISVEELLDLIGENTLRCKEPRNAE